MKCINGLKIIHFNARSLKSNFEQIRMYLTTLDVSFHIIAISDTWFTGDTDPSEFNLHSYETVYTNKNEKRGGGVLIYVNKELQFVKINDFSVSLDNVFESVTIEIKVENKKNFIVACVHRTPGSETEGFSEYIERLLQSVNNNKSIYLCSDLNFDLLKRQNHQGTNDFLELLYSYGLFPKITKPTRVTSISATLIDNIYTNNVFQVNCSGILCNDITDHLPIFCTSHESGVKKDQVKSYRYVRKFDETSVSAFKSALDAYDWDTLFIFSSVNDAYDYFMNSFTEMYESYFPKRKVLVDSKNDLKPWLSKGLINAYTKKNKLYKDFIRTRSKLSEDKYKRYENKLTSILRYSQKQYYTNLLENNRNNIKATWDIVNSVIIKEK